LIFLPSPPPVRRCKRFAKQNLAAGGIHFRRGCHVLKVSAFHGAGKKKMRNLGTVQVPTEAFMAVLKLDSD